MRSLLVGLALLASAAAYVEVDLGYHEKIGIPHAAEIKAAEDAIMAKLSETEKQIVVDPHIVGGVVSANAAHPFLGGLLINLWSGGLSACGSSLISQNRAVTAAHCWFDGWNQAWQFTIALGTNMLFYGGTRIATSQVVLHPQWNTATLANDVAVIYLPQNVLFSNTIQAIALPSSGQLWETFAGEWAVAAGYGKTNDAQTGISTNSVISHVNIQVISVAQCQAVFGNWALASNICTNGAGGVGICSGDSGGPLYINRWGQNILAGLVISLVNVAGNSVCGSSLLSANRLVTAARCWFDGRNQAWQFTVVLGSHWLFSGGTRVSTTQVVLHPQWNADTLANDVAVIYLPSKVGFTGSILPVALPSTTQMWETFAGESGVAAGYGTTSDRETYVSTSTVVSHVTLPVITVAQCQASFGYWALDSNICTNGAGGVGICGGDPGGPLTVVRNGQNILVGIGSFVAAAGCQQGYPSVFTRVTSFYSFIIQNL